MKKREISALVPIGESFEMVDPSDLKSISTYFLIDNLGIKLLHVNAKNDYEHILAEKISFDDSKKIVTIRIKDALFSDGSTITSNDVLNTLKRLIVVGSAHIPIKDFIDESCHISSLDNVLSEHP